MSSALRSALVASLAVVAIASAAHAEPVFAQREGYRCSQCHVNRTGGGKRTPFGYQWALTHLSLLGSAPPEGAEPAARTAPGDETWSPIDPQITDSFSVGANLRLDHNTVFAKKRHNSFEQSEANLYTQFDASRHLTVYVDTGVAQGTVGAREAFLMAHGKGLTLKGGYMLLPFGLGIWGEDEAIRRQTGYNYASPDLGVEIGWERRGFGAFVAVTNGSGGGSDPDNDKKLSLWLDHVFSVFRFGFSGSTNQTETVRQTIGGAHAGLALGRLGLLAETDVVQARFLAAQQNLRSLVAYVEANLLVLRGVNLKVSYGYHDPDLDARQDQRFSIRSGVEVAPMPFLITGVSYRLARSVPQDEVGNAGSLLAQVHVYF